MFDLILQAARMVLGAQESTPQSQISLHRGKPRDQAGPPVFLASAAVSAVLSGRAMQHAGRSCIGPAAVPSDQRLMNIRRPWQIPRQSQQHSVAINKEHHAPRPLQTEEAENLFFITGVAANPHQELLQVGSARTLRPCSTEFLFCTQDYANMLYMGWKCELCEWNYKGALNHYKEAQQVGSLLFFIAVYRHDYSFCQSQVATQLSMPLEVHDLKHNYKPYMLQN
jgi:hypothetical protein